MKDYNHFDKSLETIKNSSETNEAKFKKYEALLKTFEDPSQTSTASVGGGENYLILQIKINGRIFQCYRIAEQNDHALVLAVATLRSPLAKAPCQEINTTVTAFKTFLSSQPQEKVSEAEALINAATESTKRSVNYDHPAFQAGRAYAANQCAATVIMPTLLRKQQQDNASTAPDRVQPACTKPVKTSEFKSSASDLEASLSTL